MGVWIEAKSGEIMPDGKVNSRLGHLCFRPGWHLSELPYATHIGKKSDGAIKYMHDDEVWCECEYSAETSYQELADANGWHGTKFVERDAYIKDVPVDGYYMFKTSPVMYGKWIIAGKIKVNRVLTDDEVSRICAKHGLVPMLHKDGFDYSTFLK